MAEVSPLLVAALSDRYVVERELGHGGMATVYLWRYPDPELQPYLEEAPPGWRG